MAAVWAGLLLAGKVLPWILAAVLVLLLILLLVPAWAVVEYRDSKLTVTAGMLCFHLCVYPWRGGREKPAKKAGKKPKRAGRRKKKQTGELSREKAKLTVDQICAGLRGAGRFMRTVVGALRVSHIRIELPVHADDAAATALAYGRANAWLHGSLAVLSHFLWMDFDELRLEPDFTGKSAGEEYFSCKISAQLIIMVTAAIRLLILLYQKKILDAFL